MWITLTGFMGSGKSTVARIVGAELDWPVVALDEHIVRSDGRPIARIFAEDGEPFFRALELECLESLDPAADQVLDGGGGLMQNPEAARRIRAAGPVFWLDVRWEQVCDRLRGDELERRPLAAGVDAGRLEKLYRRRRLLYARMADFRLPSSETGPEPTARRLLARWEVWRTTRPLVTPPGIAGRS